MKITDEKLARMKAKLLSDEDFQIITDRLSDTAYMDSLSKMERKSLDDFHDKEWRKRIAYNNAVSKKNQSTKSSTFGDGIGCVLLVYGLPLGITISLLVSSFLLR